MCELRSRSISVVSYWDHPTSAAPRVMHTSRDTRLAKPGLRLICRLETKKLSEQCCREESVTDAGRVRHAVGSGGVVVLQSTVQSTDAEVNLTTKRFTQLDQLLDQVHRLSPLLR